MREPPALEVLESYMREVAHLELVASCSNALCSIRQRLQRLYPGQHELKLITEPDTFLIALSLQFAPQLLPTRWKLQCLLVDA